MMQASTRFIRSKLARGLLLLALAAGIPSLACAGQMAPPKPGESKAKAAIRAVLADPVFGGETEEMEWQYTGGSADSAPEKAEKMPGWIKVVQDVIEFVSSMLRYLVWLAMALLVAVLIYFSYRHRHAWLGSFRKRPAPPSFLFGLDVRPESLPDDVASAALRELARGNATGALSLLYRGALVSLIHRSQLDFHAGHTEDDCLRLARATVDAGCSGYFAELLQAWKLTAYAHEAPPVPALEALCTGWRVHFAQVGGKR